MTVYRMLDLFGGEGLAALGYAQAGFMVDTVEIDPERIAHHARHPNITVHRGNAITWPLAGYDVVVGGPPCTEHTTRAGLAEAARGGTVDTAWMLAYTRARFQAWAAATGGLYVVENVVGAKASMCSPLILCGSMFDLVDGEWLLERHRLFESNAPLMAPGPHRCRGASRRGRRIIGVYGDLTANDRACGGRVRPGGDMRAGVERARRLMQAPPETSPRGLSLGIPPAYTRAIGAQLISHLAQKVPA